MTTKEHRQKRIQEIVAREVVSTQAELVDRLRAERIQVTQATVSRDINELRLVRLPLGQGRHRYALAPLSVASDVRDELRRRARDYVLDLDLGENLIVVRTVEGHANGVAYLLDRMGRDDIVGTLAGQDTILVVARTTGEAEPLLADLQELLL